MCLSESVKIKSDMTRYDDPSLCAQIVDVVAQSKVPVSIDYIRHHVGVGWQTARAALLNLVFEGRLVGKKTTAGWIFLVNEEGKNREADRTKAQLSSTIEEGSGPS